MLRLQGHSRVETSDGDLVRRVRTGDTDAFGVLVARYRVRFARYTVQMVGNAEDAEEVLQDALVRAYRALDRCENPDRFGAWFFRILTNRCRTRRKRRLRKEKFEGISLMEEHHTMSRDGAAAFAWREAIGAALLALPPDHRQAFLLKHVEGLSYEEMAGLTGAGISALKMRVMRACERLRELLDGER